MNIAAIAPEIVLAIGALFVMAADVATGGRRNLGWITAVIVALSMAVVIMQIDRIEVAFSGSVLSDRFAHLCRLVIQLGALLAVLMAAGSSRAKGSAGIFGAEFYALLLVSVIGMDLLVIGANLAVVFLALETLSLPLYAMAAGRSNDDAAVEAGAKYFLNGAFASGFLLFGIALVYGATGSLSFEAIGRAITAGLSHDLWVWIGGVLIVIGFLFKIAAVPFHAWAPDVYAGAPTPAVAFFSAAPKAAAIGLLLRLTLTAMVDVPLTAFLWVVAWLSMLVGNIWALRQNDLKRLLAYSGIAHVGYVLVGMCAGQSGAVGAVGFYLLTYAGMAVGGFAAIGAVSQSGGVVTFDTIAGLGRKQPLTAAIITVFMFALAGIPPTAGFVGKFVLFSEALRGGYLGLVIWAVIFSAISLYYYLRVVVAMWMWPPSEAAVSVSATPNGLRPVLILSALICLIPGIYPQPFLELAGRSLFWLL